METFIYRFKKNINTLIHSDKSKQVHWPIWNMKCMVRAGFFLTLLLLFGFGTSAQSVVIPDANFKAALVANGAINTNGDAEIQISEAVAFNGTIDVSSKSIADLTGIEEFVNITELNCSINQLTHLDVSANTALTILNCNSNQLTSLNVTANTAVTSLRCNFNDLTTLNVTPLTSLTYLDCHQNEITSLDIKANTLLETLYTESNQLTELDVSMNTALKLLYFQSNQLTEIDLSANTALTNMNSSSNPLGTLDVSNSPNLSTLYCYSNQLSTLDLSSNTALSFLFCIGNQFTNLDLSNNTLLWYLQCSNNQLTSLDLSANTAMKQLYASNNQLKNLDLRAHTALIQLSCKDNQLINLDLRNGNNANLGMMEAENNSLTCIVVDDVSGVQSFWKKDAATTYCDESPTLNIPDANFKSELVGNALINTNGDAEIQMDEAADFTGTINVSNKSIADLTGIEAFVRITELDCSINQLTALDVGSNTSLEILNCNSNQLTSLDVSTNTKLTSLRVNFNDLTALDIDNNTALTYLDCHNNEILSLNLGNNLLLETLYAESNKLTALDVGVNTALKLLYCWGNQLTSLDVSTNTALQNMNCSSNPLGTLDVSNSPNLSVLYCYGNQLSTLDLSNNTALSFLFCRGNQFTNLDLSKNTALAYVQCSSNQLTHLDVSANTVLKQLYCTDNQLTSLDVSANSALIQLSCKNNQLTDLDLRNGNNANLGMMEAENNSLTCIVVDDVSGVPSHWKKDAETTYCSDSPSSVTINSSEGTETELSPFPITITFSEEVTGFELTDLTITNGAASDLQTTDNIVFAASITPVAHGTITVNLASHSVTNLAGNPNRPADEFTIAYDNSPTVSFTPSSSDPTNQSPFEVTITFSQEVVGFDLTDLIAVNGTPDNLQTVDNTIFTIDMLPTSQGVVTLDMEADRVLSLEDAPNEAADQFSLTFDNVSPVGTMSSSEVDFTSQSSFSVEIVFNEEIIGFEITDLDLTNCTVDNLETADNKQFSLTVAPSKTGTVAIDLAADKVQDLAGNANEASEQFSIEYDNSPPTCEISSPLGSMTNQPSFEITFTFSEEVDGFELGDVELINGTVDNLKTTDNIVFSMDLTPALSGTVTIDLPDDKVVDFSGNGNISAVPFSIEYDGISPTCEIGSTQDNTTNQSSFPVTITFNEEVVGFELEDLTLTNATATNLETTDHIVFTLDLEPLAEGTVAVDLAADRATDKAGNGNSTAAQFGIEYIVVLGSLDGSEGGFVLYPNPTDDFLIVQPGKQLPKERGVQMSLTNIEGKEVLNKQMFPNDDEILTIDLTSYPSGVYLIRMAVGDTENTMKLIKR